MYGQAMIQGGQTTAEMAPRREDHQGSLPRRPARAIRQRPRDGEVPIEADHQQVQDTGIGRQVIDGQPDVADDLPEAPFLLQDEDGEQGHADGPDDDVSHGQWEQEVVGDGLELLVHLETDHDHQVAGDCDQAE